MLEVSIQFRLWDSLGPGLRTLLRKAPSAIANPPVALGTILFQKEKLQGYLGREISHQCHIYCTIKQLLLLLGSCRY